MGYINMGMTSEYNAADDWYRVCNEDGYLFDFGPRVEEESFHIYQLKQRSKIDSTTDWYS